MVKNKNKTEPVPDSGELDRIKLLKEEFDRILRRRGKIDKTELLERFAFDVDENGELLDSVGTPRLAHEDEEIGAVAITPDGMHVFSGSENGMITIWDLKSGDQINSFSARKSGIDALVAGPDGTWILSSSLRTIEMWDLATGSILRRFIGPLDMIKALAVTPDGEYAISGSMDHQKWGGRFSNVVQLWDLHTGKELRILGRHKDIVTAVTCTPDAKLAISASSDKTIQVWSLKRKRSKLNTLRGHTGSVESVAVTADGLQVISGSADTTLKIWDLLTGTEVRTLRGHAGTVNAVVLMPDGQRAVSVSEDWTLKVWELQNGDPIATFTADCPQRTCAVAPDGLTIVSGDNLGRLHFLRLEQASNNE